MQKLIQAREEIGLSRQRFAELVGIAPQKLRLYEIGELRPQMKNVRRLATALGVEPETIAEFQHAVRREESEREVRERLAGIEKV